MRTLKAAGNKDSVSNVNIIQSTLLIRKLISHMLPTLRTTMPNIPRHNIRGITIWTSIQKTRYNIRISDKTCTMKFYGHFNQRFTPQAVPCIHGCNRGFIWWIPDYCGIAAGMTIIAIWVAQIILPILCWTYLKIARRYIISKENPRQWS